MNQGQPMQGNHPGYPVQGFPQGQPSGGGYPPNQQASAPPASLFDAVSGYEQTTFGQGYLPPPPVAPVMPDQKRPDEQFVGHAAITSEEARDAMLDFVASHCCYGKAPANEMVIHDIKPSSAYHYKLSTFTEARSTSWQVEPFTGQIIDGPHNGPALGPWQISVQPPQMFSPSSTRVEVPHTASVKQCHDCCGGGYKQCQHCMGRAWDKCSKCHGRGRVEDEFRQEKQCTVCGGSGQTRCNRCNGDGRVRCTICQSHGKLKTFIQLTVTWKKHDEDHVVERSQGGPKEKVAGASGIQIFHQELPRVWPVTTFFDKDVNIASQRIVNKHGNAWPQEMILMQRQTLRAVPVAEVAYGWKDGNLRFWVYGSEPRQVFAPDYPQQCFCGCVIL